MTFQPQIDIGKKMSTNQTTAREGSCKSNAQNQKHLHMIRNIGNHAMPKKKKSTQIESKD